MEKIRIFFFIAAKPVPTLYNRVDYKLSFFSYEIQNITILPVEDYELFVFQ